ncbi:hypothetical protein F4801DRAFT_345361 [Xylaria longipes]|nr:hypothetical protein F4801DRAFT_345361 [Xylaria longipes]
MMDEPNSVQLMTEENLRRLRNVQRQQLPSESLTSSDFLPIDKLEKAKRRVYNFLWDLRNIGAEGDRIRDAEDVYIADRQEVHYRGNVIPEPDLQDPSFWEAKLVYLQQTHGPGIRLTRARRGVCHYMTLLRKFGREGRKVLADYELYLVGKDDIRYRGSADPEPDLQDPTYLEAQREYLRSKYGPLRKARYPPLSPLEHRSLNSEEKKKYAEQQKLIEENNSTDFLWAWSKRKREIRAWSNAQHAEASLSGPEIPIFHDPPGRTTAANIEDSISHRSEETPYFRWHDAYRGVYERMAALWNLGGEGREIVKNDELRIMGRYDVRYRRSRGPKPNLEDPKYWEGKWEYFTDKYISLLRGSQHSSQVLSELTLDRWNIPVPGPSSCVLSSISSRLESLQPTSESIRAEEIKTAKESLYNILTLEFFHEEGRKILEDDDVYIAGIFDVRYRHKVGPEPNLQDPQYWLDKIAYFYGHYLNSRPEEERNFARRLIIPASESTWYPERPSLGRSVPAPQRGSTPLLHMENQPQEPTTIPRECQTAPAQDHMDKENCAPCLGVTIMQAMELPKASKRKRGSHSDDTDQAENQLSHPAKRSKPEMRQASETRAAATRSSPAAARSPKTPTGDAIARQLRASDPTLDRGVTQSSVAPVVIEELENRATRTPPQRRKRQRKVYEKERTSRRLAGQSPEFGLLPERGKELRPYEAPLRRAATRGMTSMISKPAAVRSTRSRVIPKPTEGGESRQRRSKRN